MLSRFKSSKDEGSSSGSIINEEMVEYSQTQQLNKWTIPSISSRKIYHKCMFQFISQDNIKTVEQTIPLEDSEQTLRLLNLRDIERYLSKSSYIHIGCIQIAFKPLTFKGLNASILAYLRDGRCLNFKDSLMGIIQTSLCYGPVHFDVYPDFTLSLRDRNLFEAIILKIKTQGYEYLPGSDTIGVVFRIHYKVMNTLCPNAVLRGNPGKTVVIDSNYLTTKVVVPKLITWENVGLVPG